MALKEIISQIKSNPLSSVVGQYISINKQGHNFQSICPFHDDTKPSMSISDEKQIFKCFACGASGDHIEFVKRYRGIEFIDAVKETASMFNIPTDDLDQKKPKDPRKEMANRVLTAAYKLYRKYAATSHQKEYKQFLKDRGLSEEMAAQFGIGYAPKGNVLLKYLQSVKGKEGAKAIEMALELGIIKEGQKGLYDGLRARITFPIKDLYGNIVCFQSRATLPDQVPKYLHLKESFIFKKRNILYGLNIAKSHIRSKDSVIIVEGNMDAISLHQFGFNQAVATMGTACTEVNLNRLLSMSKNIFLAMDNDSAGLKAMAAINDFLVKSGVQAKFIDLSPEKDPDDFLQNQGRMAFSKIMDEAKTFIDTMIDRAIPETIPEDAGEKHQILVEEIFPLVAPLKEDLMATERILQVAKRLGFQSDTSAILGTYKNYLATRDQNENSGIPRVNPNLTAAPSASNLQQEEHIPGEIQEEQQQLKLNAAEKTLIREILRYPQVLAHATEGKILDFVTQNEVKKLIQWVSKIYLEVDDGEFINVVKDSLSASEFHSKIKEVVYASLFNLNVLTVDEERLEKLVGELIRNLSIDQLKAKRKELLTKKNNFGLDEEILTEIAGIDKKLLDLKMNKA